MNKISASQFLNAGMFAPNVVLLDKDRPLAHIKPITDDLFPMGSIAYTFRPPMRYTYWGQEAYIKHDKQDILVRCPMHDTNLA